MLGEVDYPPEVAIRVCQTWVRDRRLLGLPRKNSHKIPLLDLVDEGFLDRFADGSQWWRCGGTVDLDVDSLLAEAAQRQNRPRRRKRSQPLP